MESSVPCARAVAASRSLAPRTRTHTTPANAPSSDGEQCALCEGRGCFQESGFITCTHRTPANAPSSDGEQCALCEGRGCFQESGPPTRAHGPLPTRHPLRWRAVCLVPGPWLLPGAWPPHPCSRPPANAPPSPMESSVSCARAVAASRSLAPPPVLTEPLPTRHPLMESSVPCARAVAASRSLAPPPVLTGPCQSATLSDGEQSAMRQGLGAFQESGFITCTHGTPANAPSSLMGRESPVPGS
ncbi:hypothetical protein NDU88_006850 [Pleurodeles waltl]|uniref:Uncharacterized protein n=1 Tax=Pleurodeles waltl TaxID=8319 RepID=A0AAV7LRV4_PLEWA|nr:hypothetical protein NDU88_006850 [Pleurodeles waltl]